MTTVNNPKEDSTDELIQVVSERFKQFLDSRKMRQTSERFAILERVCRTDVHFSVEGFHELMEREGFHVSRATVYNTMQLLTDAGIVRRHLFDQKSAEYERVSFGAANHYHLVCTECGKVQELKDSDVGEILSHKRYKNFMPSYFTLYVYGLCSKCRRTRGDREKKRYNQSHI